ncbi:hypothetical protein BS78_03G206500 [Paspalum vaginatum]|nr:hypothetical protein BS78_03G206500 [Paspalum vaginatum]
MTLGAYTWPGMTARSAARGGGSGRPQAACMHALLPSVLASSHFGKASKRPRGGRPGGHSSGQGITHVHVLSGSHGNGHGRKRRTCPHLGRRTQLPQPRTPTRIR